MALARRAIALLVVALVAASGLIVARAATPSKGTVSLDKRSVSWEGHYYAAGSTLFAGTTCPATGDDVCDTFTLTVDIDESHWDKRSGGADVRIAWASAEDDFDLHVFDDGGELIGSSIQEGTTSERVLVDDASGTYTVRVNPFSVIDSGYSGSVQVVSRKKSPRAGGKIPDEPIYDRDCRGGTAGPFPCEHVDLQAFLPHDSIGGGEGNDIWGWTDRKTDREYAIVGKTHGTAFVDITNATKPRYLGFLPSFQPVETIFNTWRDVKVFKNHAYVVSEEPTHGMQVFDLTRLRSVEAPQTFTEDAHYGLFGGAHNVAINTDSGFAYAVGTNTCQGGPHVVDINSPKNPVFAGCVLEDGYTHDTQCVIYEGPDADFKGREICFSSNEDTLTIVDVTDKLMPVQLARLPYEGAAYTHQGWLTGDQRHFLLGDELDEVETGVNTTTYIFDVSSLTKPKLRGVYRGETKAIDHNLYTKGKRVYEANYRAGLRILTLRNVDEGKLREVAYFDVYPANDAPEFNGAWSTYPYFKSGNVIVNGIEQGLFVLRP